MSGTVVRNPYGSEQKASRRRIPDPWVGLVRYLHFDRLWPKLLAGKRLNLMHAPYPLIYGPPRGAREKSLFGRRRSCSHISGILVRSQRAPRALMEFAGLPVLITRTVSAKPACE